MATGGRDSPSASGIKRKDEDFRHSCGLCLEPYRDRIPKLLPCYHSYCLPCLRDLEASVKVAATKQGQAASVDPNDQGDGGEGPTGPEESEEGEGRDGESEEGEGREGESEQRESSSEASSLTEAKSAETEKDIGGLVCAQGL